MLFIPCMLSFSPADKRISLLKHGRIDIVQFIRDLPKTQHHSQLFQVDLMTSSVSSTYSVWRKVVVFCVFPLSSQHVWLSSLLKLTCLSNIPHWILCLKPSHTVLLQGSQHAFVVHGVFSEGTYMRCGVWMKLWRLFVCCSGQSAGCVGSFFHPYFCSSWQWRRVSCEVAESLDTPVCNACWV